MSSTRDQGPAPRSSAPQAVTWAEVLRCLGPGAETRALAISHFRKAGFSADSFAHKTKARQAAAAALTAAEDWLEVEHPRAGERAAVRLVRRRLETECWP